MTAENPSDALEVERGWPPRENAALADLLDHIAEELAREYICLMDAAAKNRATPDNKDS